jgi:hypothetical protein
MRSVTALFMAAGLVIAAASPSSAQDARATARLGGGQTATATAKPVEGEGVLLEIALPGGSAQSFPGLGQALVAVDGKPGGAGLLARDLTGDGIDEIIIRGAVPPDRGAMLVFRWDGGAGEFVPVDFTDDRDRTNKFLVVDAREPVILNGSGVIEAQYVTTRQDGRKSSHVARYRWTGKGFSASGDN